MLKIKAISKVLIVLIFIQVIASSIYADNCFQNITGIIQHQQGLDQNDSEYILKFNLNSEIINQNFNFIKLENLPAVCNNKRFVLLIDSDKNFRITGGTQEIKISGALDEVRFDSNSQNIINIRFFVDNNELQLVGQSTPGSFTIDISETKILTNTKIDVYERERSFINNNDNINSLNRVGHGVRLNFKDIIIYKDANLEISLIAKKPKDGAHSNEYTLHGTHGGTARLYARNIINYGNVDINIFSAEGSKGSLHHAGMNRLGAIGGNGGLSSFFAESIQNYKLFNIFLKSEQGSNGTNGSDEQGFPGCEGSPRAGGAGGNGGDLYFIVKNIYNKKLSNGQSAKLNINLKSGSGGNGGNAGDNHCIDDAADGGVGGNGGLTAFMGYGILNTNIDNQGKLNYNIISGDSGFGGTKTKSGIKGSSGAGGDIFDFNVSRFVNTGDFNYYALGGKVNINNDYIGTGRAGNIGSINIENLNNFSQNFNINIELNEKNIENISSITCACQENCSIVGDPKIGNININYLKPGSFLPRSLKIIKQVPINDTTINISGCYVLSSGNSSISYAADNLILKLSNLADIQYDFDESENMTANNIFEKIVCPVCDSLELNNFALRTDTEYTIYTDQGDAIIADLNIYYVNPDGSLFRPPGYPSNKDYVVYSLKNGETITSTQNQFIGTNIKEYKISKEKLHYNPENFDLTNIPAEKGYDTEDVRLFCQAQRYLLRFRPITPNPFDDNPIKEIYFTPLFDIK